MLTRDARGQFDLLWASSLRETLDLIAREPFDAILLDLSLPDSHGLDTIKQMCEAVPKIPILVVTGSTDEQIAMAAVRCGAEDYLVKGQTDVAAIARAIRYAIDRKRTQQERETTIDFLRLVTGSTGTRELIRAAAIFFQQQSGCEAVGVRLKEGDDYPYFEARGFPPEFLLVENSLCARDSAGAIVRDSDGLPICECMCGNVICGRFDPSKPFFTAAGSFWTNNTTELLTSTTDADRQARTRNRCNGEGYESVALIALRRGETQLGLLQLNDRRKGLFTPETIALWERLAGYLGVAIANARAEEALRQSEERFRVTARVLDILNQPGSLLCTINEILRIIKQYTGFDAIGIRIREGEDFPYYVQSGFTREFVHVENVLCCRTPEGALRRDETGRPILECTCGVVLSGQTDPAIPLFTSGGSFWSNDTAPLLELSPEQDPRQNPRNRCIHEGFMSVALIPIRVGQQIVGLLQLNDRRRNCFTLDMIRFFEEIAGSIGIALKRQQAADALSTSETRLRLAHDAAKAGTWEWNLRTNKNVWSEATWNLYGMDPNRCEASYEAWRQVIHPEDRPRAEQVVLDAKNRGTELNVEFRVNLPDEAHRWLMARGQPVHDAEGRVISYQGIVVDITPLKQADERTQLLSEVTAELLRSDRPQQIIELLCRRVMNHLGCHVFFNFLLDEPTGRLHLNACAGIPAETARQIEWLDYGVAVCGCVARDGCPVVSEHIQTTPDRRADLVRSFGIQAYACHPLLNQGQTIGTLSFGSRAKPTFTQDELDLMKTVTDHVAIAMQRIRAHANRIEKRARRGCGIGQRRQEPVPGQHEPRAPHADERHPRHDRFGAGRRSLAHRARLSPDGQAVGRQPA